MGVHNGCVSFYYSVRILRGKVLRRKWKFLSKVQNSKNQDRVWDEIQNSDIKVWILFVNIPRITWEVRHNNQYSDEIVRARRALLQPQQHSLVVLTTESASFFYYSPLPFHSSLPLALFHGSLPSPFFYCACFPTQSPTTPSIFTHLHGTITNTLFLLLQETHRPDTATDKLQKLEFPNVFSACYNFRQRVLEILICKNINFTVLNTAVDTEGRFAIIKLSILKESRRWSG